MIDSEELLEEEELRDFPPLDTNKYISSPDSRILSIT